MVLTLKQNVTINSNPRDKRTMNLLTSKKTEREWLLFNWSGFISSFFSGHGNLYQLTDIHLFHNRLFIIEIMGNISFLVTYVPI